MRNRSRSHRECLESQLRRTFVSLGTCAQEGDLTFRAMISCRRPHCVGYLCDGNEVDGAFVVRGVFFGALTGWHTVDLAQMCALLRCPVTRVMLATDFPSTTWAELQRSATTDLGC